MTVGNSISLLCLYCVRQVVCSSTITPAHAHRKQPRSPGCPNKDGDWKQTAGSFQKELNGPAAACAPQRWHRAFILLLPAVCLEGFAWFLLCGLHFLAPEAGRTAAPVLECHRDRSVSRETQAKMRDLPKGQGWYTAWSELSTKSSMDIFTSNRLGQTSASSWGDSRTSTFWRFPLHGGKTTHFYSTWPSRFLSLSPENQHLPCIRHLIWSLDTRPEHPLCTSPRG